MSQGSPISSENIDEISRRLDALIRLTLEHQRSHEDELTIGDQILILEDAGLSASEVGAIVGIPSKQHPAYIRKAKNKKLRLKVEKKKGSLHE
jgi:hypothetical protein